MTSLGEKIKTARKAVRLSQGALARRMGFAEAADGAICKWESGEREPTLHNLTKLATALQLTLPDLLNGAVAKYMFVLTRGRERSSRKKMTLEEAEAKNSKLNGTKLSWQLENMKDLVLVGE